MLDEEIKCDKKCFQMVVDAVKYYSEVYKQPLDDKFKPRGEETTLTIQGVDEGSDAEDSSVDEDNNDTGMYTCTKSKILSDVNVKCEKAPLSCEIAKESLCLVRVNNFIYLLGVEYDTFTSVTKRFDETTKLWIDLKPASDKTVYCTTAYIKGSILRVGGRITTEDKLGGSYCGRIRECDLNKTVVKYSISNNMWKSASNFPTKVACHAGGLFTQVNVEVKVQVMNQLLLMRKSVAITES